EGNGAALYEGGELLAIILPWSGVNRFHGYARDSIGEGPVAWEIGTHNALIGRFREAESYWRQWEEANPWPAIQDAFLSPDTRGLTQPNQPFAIQGKTPASFSLCFTPPTPPCQCQRLSHSSATL